MGYQSIGLVLAHPAVVVPFCENSFGNEKQQFCFVVFETLGCWVP